MHMYALFFMCTNWYMYAFFFMGTDWLETTQVSFYSNICIFQVLAAVPSFSELMDSPFIWLLLAFFIFLWHKCDANLTFLYCLLYQLKYFCMVNGLGTRSALIFGWVICLHGLDISSVHLNSCKYNEPISVQCFLYGVHFALLCLCCLYAYIYKYCFHFS